MQNANAMTLREMTNEFDSLSEEIQTIPTSKRAFDRLDVSTFDFNKRFNEIEDESPLAKLVIGQKLPSTLAKVTQQKGIRSKSRSAARKKPIARVHGFGFFGPMRFRKRAAEPLAMDEQPTFYDFILL